MNSVYYLCLDRRIVFLQQEAKEVVMTTRRIYSILLATCIVTFSVLGMNSRDKVGTVLQLTTNFALRLANGVSNYSGRHFTLKIEKLSEDGEEYGFFLVFNENTPDNRIQMFLGSRLFSSALELIKTEKRLKAGFVKVSFAKTLIKIGTVNDFLRRLSENNQQVGRESPLCFLDLSGCSAISKEDFSLLNLKELKSLFCLHLDGTNVSADVLQEIFVACEHLREIGIDSCAGISPNDWSKFEWKLIPPRIENLLMRANSLKAGSMGNCLKTLAKREHLREVHFSGCDRILQGEWGRMRPGKIKILRTACFSGTNIVGKFVKEFIKENRNLTVLNIAGCNRIEQGCFSKFLCENLSSLVYLDVSGTRATRKFFNNIMCHCEKLEVLKLFGCTVLEEKDFEEIEWNKAEYIKEYDFSQTSIGEKTVERIAELLSKSKDEPLIKLHRCRNISENFIKSLKEKFPSVNIDYKSYKISTVSRGMLDSIYDTLGSLGSLMPWGKK